VLYSWPFGKVGSDIARASWSCIGDVRPSDNVSIVSRSRAAFTNLQENSTSWTNPSTYSPQICSMSLSHATIVSSAKLSPRHTPRHTNRSEAMPQLWWRSSRLNAKDNTSTPPSIQLQRRALRHGAEPLVHVFVTHRFHGGVLVILSIADSLRI
jgi:hypothetical protein